jgi:hypothetical protein
MFSLRVTAGVLVATVLAAGAVRAEPATYTFSGIGDGTVGGTPFSGAFTFTIETDTTLIDASGAPFFRLNNVGGTFTEGAFTATLTPTVTIVATADPATPRINLFNSTLTMGWA